MNTSRNSSQNAIKYFLSHPLDVRKSLNMLFDGQGDEFIEEGLEQIKIATKYLKKNWKTVVLAAAVLGLGAYFAQKVSRGTTRRYTTRGITMGGRRRGSSRSGARSASVHH